MKKPALYFIRHGETDWNVLGKLQGTIDIALNDRGREQAANAAKILTDLLARDRREASSFDFVASPLRRARETMEIIRRALNLPPQQYAVDERLREIAYGEWEGLTMEQAEARDPDIYAKRLADKWVVAAPGGESYAAVQARVSDWYAELGADTIVAAHGGTARALMVLLGLQAAHIAADLYIEQGVVYVFGEGGLTKYS
jgi:probable phosphoglycerate mutase